MCKITTGTESKALTFKALEVEVKRYSKRDFNQSEETRAQVWLLL